MGGFDVGDALLLQLFGCVNSCEFFQVTLLGVRQAG